MVTTGAVSLWLWQAGEISVGTVAMALPLAWQISNMAGWVGDIGPVFLPLAALFALHLSRQAAAVRTDDGPGALKLFKSNAMAGLIVFAALVAGLWKPGVSF